MRDILVTYALLYANGQAHLGHLLGFIQTDIFCRFQRLQGHRCYYICGADMHGTPIMIRAQEKGLDPAEMAHQIAQEQLRDVQKFHILFDNFYHTDSLENKALSYDFYRKLKNNHDIITQTISQAFDEEKQMFLPDRFIKGTCPTCKTSDQYGDSCEHCGATYSPTDLINPVSVLSGKPPIPRQSEHYFFDLPKYETRLRAWIKDGKNVQEAVANKLNEWLDAGLKIWDISRDSPYFGFEIPNAPGKYFYVWLDAPIGYLASFKNYADQQTKTPEESQALFDRFFDPIESQKNHTELYHFIGKDITYFHTLFWPALLMGSNTRLPNSVFTHGFLTVDGKKMSKSRGTFITANRYAKHLNPEYLRYYFAAKLGSEVEDIDLNLSDFMLRVNSDLVGKVINIASRCAGFIKKYFDNTLSKNLVSLELADSLKQASSEIATAYEAREYATAVRKIMSLADLSNQFIDQYKPWGLIKQEGQETQESQAHQVCTQGLNCFRHLIIYLKPILPELAEKSEDFLNIPALTWQDSGSALLDHRIHDFVPLMTRIDETTLEAMVHDVD
jgi:methionyl-tRNA synthetase